MNIKKKKSKPTQLSAPGDFFGFAPRVLFIGSLLLGRAFLLGGLVYLLENHPTARVKFEQFRFYKS